MNLNQRIIKYRAWDNNNEKFWYFEYPSIKSSWDWEFFDLARKLEYPLSQFTGLFDSKNNEIWEGDILTVPNTYYRLFQSCDWKGSNDGYYLINWNEKMAGFLAVDIDTDIINYDNPFLSEKGQYLWVSAARYGVKIGNCFEDVHLLKKIIELFIPIKQ